MSITTRLGLHKPDTPAERFGDYFSDMYAADLQQIDDSVQIKNVPAAGNIPVYGVDGLLMDSGIAPGELEAGLITSILTDQGMLLFKSATALAALSPDVAGKSLITQGAGADPVFGYPSHGTLTNLAIGDPHTQYVLRTVLAARGDLVYRDATGWQRLPKGLSGKVLMQGADDPYWSMPKLDELAIPGDTTTLDASIYAHGLMPKYPNTAQVLKGNGTWLTRNFEIDFPVGNGQDVIEDFQYLEVAVPVNCKIIRADLWIVPGSSSSPLTGAITAELYVHDFGTTRGSMVDEFIIPSNQSYYTETGLNISVAQHKVIQVTFGYTTTVKQAVLRLFCEAT